MRNALRSKAVDLSAVVVDLGVPMVLRPTEGDDASSARRRLLRCTRGKNISTGGPLNCRSLRCASLRSG